MADVFPDLRSFSAGKLPGTHSRCNYIRHSAKPLGGMFHPVKFTYFIRNQFWVRYEASICYSQVTIITSEILGCRPHRVVRLGILPDIDSSTKQFTRWENKCVYKETNTKINLAGMIPDTRRPWSSDEAQRQILSDLQRR